MRHLESPFRVRISGPLRGELRAPPSKSATNRALLLAALSVGVSTVRDPLDSYDTRTMLDALTRLGVGVSRTQEGDLRVTGCGGRFPAPRAEVNTGNAGTVMRFLAAAAPLGGGDYLLDGDARMRRRPIADLTDALAQLGVRVAFPGEAGFPPVSLSGTLRGGSVRLRADRSSQFASGLLMAGGCTATGIELLLAGRPVSRPYLDLTAEWMRRFSGPPVERTAGPDGERLRVAGATGYRAADVRIDGDASAAAAIFAAAAITGGSVRITGLSDPLQPDAAFPGLLERMGCRVRREADGVEVEGLPRRGIRADLADRPDLAPSLAAVALFAEGPTTLSGAPHLRLKESDRIGDLAAGLRLLGATVDEHPDGLTVHPAPLHGARLDPRDDHRLAMAFAGIGLAVDGVEIVNPSCVGKSFPGFFDALDRLRS